MQILPVAAVHIQGKNTEHLPLYTIITSNGMYEVYDDEVRYDPSIFVCLKNYDNPLFWPFSVTKATWVRERIKTEN